jgi:hypothetical protein
MGASAWWYRCEYQDDVAAALRQLQSHVFEAGEYYKLWDEFPAHREAMAGELRMMARMMSDEFGPEGLDESLLEGLDGDGPPRSIDQARLWSAEGGTHSILDVAGISEAPQLGTVSPLDPADAERLLGSTRPAAATVEARREALLLMPLERWTGRYVVAHDNGAPSALFFFGVSGD